MDKYLKFYNDPHTYRWKTGTTTRYAVWASGDDPMGLKFETSKKVGKVSGNLDDIILQYPVAFTGKQCSGKIDFGLKIEINNEKTENKIMWKLQLGTEKAIVSDFKC